MIKYLLSMTLLMLGGLSIAQELTIEEGSWRIVCDENTKQININYNSTPILQGCYAKATYSLQKESDSIEVSSLDSRNLILTNEVINDDFGQGKEYVFSYEISNDISLKQSFLFYDNLDYFLTELRLESTQDIFSNYLSPLVTETSTSFLATSGVNRMLWVPWDNDAWVRFQAYKLDRKMTSHEVTAIYDAKNRNGFVVGSVEHDVWKNGVAVNATSGSKVEKLEVISGYVSEYTRDVLAHGKLKGTSIKSAKFLFGYFEDWRDGMETYGKANNIVAPRWEWDGPTPVGWSSWGVMQDKISYNGVIDVSDFLKNELFDKGFHDADGKTVLSLDAWAGDNISVYRLKDLTKKLALKDQIGGIYYGSFCDWNGDPERVVEGSNGQYRYKDIWLKVNGKEHRQGGVCIDPTHPGTKMAMKYHIQRYKDWGYKYVKIDFQTNGAIEADSYYNPEVTTGTQAYNEGMQYLKELIGDDLYVVLAISPIFPYQYAHGRRISCDSFSRIGETQYVLNSLSFGWWTNQIYQVNDPDHLVMRVWDTVESMGENRARATSGAITGAYIFGDNFSDRVEKGFPEESRARALAIMGNNEVTEIARTCGSFKPVEGSVAGVDGAENLFMYENDDYLYMACLNYNASTVVVNGTIIFERLGIDTDNVESIKELWTDADIKIRNDGFVYAVPAADARIYRITKKSGGAGIDEDINESNKARVSQYGDYLIINSYEALSNVKLYDTNGSLLKEQDNILYYDTEVNIGDLSSGVYILNIQFENNLFQNQKILIK